MLAKESLHSSEKDLAAPLSLLHIHLPPLALKLLPAVYRMLHSLLRSSYYLLSLLVLLARATPLAAWDPAFDSPRSSPQSHLLHNRHVEERRSEYIHAHLRSLEEKRRVGNREGDVEVEKSEPFYLRDGEQSLMLDTLGKSLGVWSDLHAVFAGSHPWLD